MPANWQTVGKDSYIFTDVEYPIKVNPPYAPEDFNPAGILQTQFHKFLPDGNPTTYSFASAPSIHFSIAGSTIIMSVSAKTAKHPAEFDITSYLKPGANTVSVQVFRFSDGTYLEGQDMWKLSGIERSVELIARPKLAVYDFFTKAGLDASYTHGEFDCSLTLNRKPVHAKTAGAAGKAPR